MNHSRGESRRPQQRALPSHVSRAHQRDDDGPVRIHGIHAVEATIANPARTIHRLLLTENAENRLADAVKTRGLKPERVSPRDLDRELGTDTVHQGAAIEVDPLEEPTLAALAEAATNGGPIIVLDQVTDPHNVGAILRSAAVFGASGLVMTRRNSPPLSGALAKSASGALEAVPVALIGNLARALEELAELGVRRIGLDGDATDAIDAISLAQPMALVLGAEGKGLRRLTRESCDALARIPSAGPLGSLNVSNAAAVALYVTAAARRRG